MDNEIIEVPDQRKMPDIVKDAAAKRLLKWICFSVSSGHVPTDAEMKEAANKEAVISFSHFMFGKSHIQADYEHATVWGVITDVLSYAKPSFGKLTHIQRAENWGFNSQDFNKRLYCVILDSNPIRQKQITRNEYKLLVGPELVARAMKNNLKTKYKKSPSRAKASAGKKIVAPSGKEYAVAKDDTVVTLGFLDQLTKADVAVLAVVKRTPREFWQDVRNGNLDHMRKVVKNTPKRKQRLKRSRAAWLKLEEIGAYDNNEEAKRPAGKKLVGHE